MDLYISLKDLGLLILFFAGLSALVILSIVLIKVGGLISKITNIIDSNKTSIDKTLNQLPETITNVNDAVVEIKGTANSATGLIDGVGETFSQAAATVEDSYSHYIDIVKNIISIAMKVKDMFK